MEENTQNSNEYTGEYGNPVEGEQPKSSVYSYSYRDNPPEATRSGDYYADNHNNQTENAQEQETVVSETQQNGWQTPPYQNTSEGQPQQNQDWQDSSRQNAESAQPQNGYTNPYRNENQNGNHHGNGFSNQPQNHDSGGSGSDNGQKKSTGLTWKKVGVCAALAVVFGIVAAICFQGVCYFSNHVLGIPTGAVSTQIGSTTDNVEYTSTVTSAAIGTMDVSGIAQHTMPSIVAITSTQEGEKYYDLFGQQYQGDDIPSSGSGFIVGKNDTELLIATNNHVIDGAKTISVQFIDEEVYEATAKGTDSSADLAVIAVKLKDIKDSTLKSIKISSLGDSSEAKVGEMVVAIGNALGYGQSVTVGYISAKNREITETSEDGRTQNKLKVIQTDAAINPGNSGGALLNMRGEVIGINSAKIADSSVEGVGYAIPISEATPIIDELMNKEVLTDEQKGYLGISGKTVTEEAASFNMPSGVYVSEVAEDGAAQKAGVKQGDIITAINDIQVTTIESLKEKANSYKKGTKVTLTLQRNSNGIYQEKKVEVTLQGEESLDGLSDDTTGRNGNNNSQNGDNGSNGNGQQENPDDGEVPDENDQNGDNNSIWGNWFDNFPFGY